MGDKTCEVCGASVAGINSFCISCGACLSPPETGADPRSPLLTGGVRDAHGEFLTWHKKIPLITNPYLVLQCIALPILAPLPIALILVAVTGGDWEIMILFLIVGAALAVLMLVIMLCLQVATGGGLETEFFISNEGAAHKAGTTTRALNSISLGGSAALGSTAGSGAGLIAVSQENNVLLWSDVRYIAVYPRVLSVVLRPKWLINPVVLYCTKDNFPAVLSLVKKYAPPVAATGL